MLFSCRTPSRSPAVLFALPRCVAAALSSLSRKVAEVRLGAMLPIAVLPMLPTLVGVDRIVAAAAGLERKPG